MKERDYRQGRVKVSPQIRQTILGLMEKEEDTSPKKKHPAKWYRAAVAESLGLTDDSNPSLRSYEDAVNQFRNKLKGTNPLDEEWHMGTLKDYPIPPEAIAKIIEYKIKARAIEADWVTIRIALWMARLSALPLSVDNLHHFAFTYAIQEELQELLGDDYEFGPNSDDYLLRLLKEQPNELLKEDFTPLTDEQKSEALANLLTGITPELIKGLTDKIKKAKGTVKQNERPHSSTEQE